jgi:hypothetical protein
MLGTILFRDFRLPVSSLKTWKTINLLVVLHGCERWSLTLREEHRPRMFQNRFVRRIFGPKEEEVAGEDCTMRIFVTSTLHQILLG